MQSERMTRPRTPKYRTAQLADFCPSAHLATNPRSESLGDVKYLWQVIARPTYKRAARRQAPNPDKDPRTVIMAPIIGTTTTRRALLGAFAATVVAAAPQFPGVTAYARGAGDIRKLNFYSGRTGEKINIIYCIDGEYIPESLAEINHFFRDWRNNKVHTIDARTVDILAAAHNLLRVDEPYMLLSGYRSPETNAMLRARSSGVARNSLHLKGQAADVRLQSRSVSEIARAAVACKAGGVGRYSGSNFVHMDCGVVRTWGR